MRTIRWDKIHRARGWWTERDRLQIGGGKRISGRQMRFTEGAERSLLKDGACCGARWPKRIGSLRPCTTHVPRRGRRRIHHHNRQLGTGAMAKYDEPPNKRRRDLALTVQVTQTSEREYFCTRYRFSFFPLLVFFAFSFRPLDYFKSIQSAAHLTLSSLVPHLTRTRPTKSRTPRSLGASSS